MLRNVGTIDRAIRAALGLAVLSLVFVGPQSLWGLVGLILLLTAAIGYCPVYHLLGISTRPGARPAGRHPA